MKATNIGKTGKKPSPASTEGSDKILIDNYLFDDLVYGHGGADDFVFTGNSQFVHLADFQAMDEGNDQLDLSSLFSKAASKKINGSNIGQYVFVDAEGYLYVDTNGSSDFGLEVSDAIARLSNVEGEKIHIRIGTFNGFIQAQDLTAPEIEAGQSFNYLENQLAGAIVATVDASDRAGVSDFRFADSDADAEDEQLSHDGYYQINNDGKISITAAGVTASIAQNDFEKGANTFIYAIEARDQAGNWSAPRTVTLNVLDVNDNPSVFTSGGTGSVAENASITTVIYKAATTDADGTDANRIAVYSLKDGGDKTLLNINSATGEVTLQASADYETKNVYNFTVVATNGTLTTEQSVKVDVSDVNEQPTTTLNSFAFLPRSNSYANNIGPGSTDIFRVVSSITESGTTYTNNLQKFTSFVNLSLSINGGSVTSLEYGAGKDWTLSAGDSWLEIYLTGTKTSASDLIELTASIGSSSSTIQFIPGTSNPDTLTGTKSSVLIWGGSGNDVINGGPGNAVILGESGADTLTGGSGDDHFVYYSALELFSGGVLVDEINGGDGDDAISIFNFPGVFTIAATDSFASRISGIEAIKAQNQTNNAININLNDNAYEAGIRRVDLSLDGNAFGDNIINVSAESGSSNGYVLTGSVGVDSITGGAGADTLSGGDGADVLAGGASADVINVGAGADRVVFNLADLSANRGAVASDAAFGATGDIYSGLNGGSTGITDTLDFSGFTTGSGNLAVAAAGANLTLGGAINFNVAAKGVLYHTAAAGTNAVVAGAVQTTFITDALAVIVGTGNGVDDATKGDGFVLIKDAGSDGTIDWGVFFINQSAGNANVEASEVQFVGVLQDIGTVANGFFI